MLADGNQGVKEHPKQYEVSTVPPLCWVVPISLCWNLSNMILRGTFALALLPTIYAPVKYVNWIMTHSCFRLSSGFPCY